AMARATTTKIIQPQPKGQITIPIAMRRALGINESSLLELTLVGDQIVISKLAPYADQGVRIYTDEEIAEFLEEDKIPADLAEWARARFGRHS
ncbi:MAG: AbrB/MazE/SpoVT family DNA-binding domain-containing protein, partial [Dehalococcoidia bacterium]